ncbi:MAG: zinc ribbon domain-containing protein [Clostridia bacterium]|nr:zinc ribbon domain-containing protein [Clostridia bacterium]
MMNNMRYISRFEDDPEAEILLLSAGPEITRIARCDKIRQKDVVPMYFDGNETEISVATALFIPKDQGRIGIGNYAVSAYESGYEGALYRNFADDLSKLGSPAEYSANGDAPSEITNRKAAEMFLAAVIGSFRSPVLAKVNGLDPLAKFVVYVELGYPTDPNQTALSPDEFTSVADDGKTVVITANAMASVLPHKEEVKSIVSAHGGKLYRYFTENVNVEALGAIPSPRFLIDEYLKAVCLRETGEKPSEIHTPELCDPLGAVYTAFDGFASDEQIKRVKLILRLGDDDEVRISLRAGDEKFFLYEMPVNFEGESYVGACAAVTSALKVLESSKTEEEVLALDDFYVQILGCCDSEAIREGRTLVQINRVRSSKMFEKYYFGLKAERRMRKNKACPVCQGTTVEGAVFCHHCGHRLLPEVKFCMKCGRGFTHNEGFCVQCGEPKWDGVIEKK